MTNQALARKDGKLLCKKSNGKSRYSTIQVRGQFVEFCEKVGLKWTCVQRKGILAKNDLKLRLKFARKVRPKLTANFWRSV